MLLRFSPGVKHKILTWIGSCLYANSGDTFCNFNRYCVGLHTSLHHFFFLGRAKLWQSHMSGLMNFNLASDGFMLNLSSVLLRLCRPFSSPNCPKLSLIDPTYCAAILDSDDQSDKRGIHLKGNLSNATFDHTGKFAILKKHICRIGTRNVFNFYK